MKSAKKVKSDLALEISTSADEKRAGLNAHSVTHNEPILDL